VGISTAIEVDRTMRVESLNAVSGQPAHTQCEACDVMTSGGVFACEKYLSSWRLSFFEYSTLTKFRLELLKAQ
jgi:hypothetical protein